LHSTQLQTLTSTFMTLTYRKGLPAICLYIILLTSSCTTPRWVRIARAGLSGPVYRTDVDLTVHKVRRQTGTGTPVIANDTVFVVAGGLKYRVANVEAGTWYIKMIPKVGYQRTAPNAAGTQPAPPSPPKVSYIDLSDDDETTGSNYVVPNYEVYAVQESELKAYNKIIVNQVAVGTMLLPIKIRRPREFNGTKYERQFATDISIGPYVGYRFKLSGNNYNSFTTLGLFAGPTLIDYVSTTSQTGSPTNGTNPDNMFAFTYGLGLVHEINGFQIGTVLGADRVSGTRVNTWPYDGQWWFSLAIGYNFLSARR
jgi:hypothetical protein